MLVKTSSRILSRVLCCVDCDAQLVRRGLRGPPKLRCGECRRLKRKSARRVKDGVTLPLGSAIVCKTCGTPIARSGGNKCFCKACALKSRQTKDLERYYRRQGREPVPGAGAEIKCAQCASPIVKTRSDRKFCDVCLRRRVNDYNNRTREAERRAAGVLIKSGITIKCDKCATEFERQTVNQRYCNRCHSEPTIRYSRERRKVDIAFALNHKMGAAIRKSLIGAKAGRSWESLVGYTLAGLVRHLERQFLPDMTWKNRGAWHVEHVQPLKSFNFKTAEDSDFRAAWALSNLRPLWAIDNLLKGPRRTHLL